MSISKVVRQRAKPLVKPFERAGRFLLQQLMAIFFGVRRRALALPAVPRILVVRLDRRVGNLLLLTPFLSSLRASLPQAQITLLCHRDMAGVLKHHPAIDAREFYVKWKLFSRQGMFAMLARLRRQRFDIAFDAGSFFGSAVTHPMITRFSGARFLVGPRRAPLSRIYHFAVPMLDENAPDIEQRLQLLHALPQPVFARHMLYARPAVLDALALEHADFLRAAEAAIVIVVGGRTSERQLPVALWADAARLTLNRGLSVTLLWGNAAEKARAEEIAALAPGARVAPSSTLDQAAVLFRAARGVAGHDTGTSHLAVAVGAKAFVAFVMTEPDRSGHPGSGVFDLSEAKDPAAEFAAKFQDWLRLIETSGKMHKR